MTIVNLLMVIAALALFMVLMGRIVKRIKSLEFNMNLLSEQCEELVESHNRLNHQLNDVRKSLDNF